MHTPPETNFSPPVQRHKSPHVQYIVIILIMLLMPFLVPEYFRSMLSKVYIFSIFAMSLNLVLGYTGLISLGHAAYLGVGGYTFGILMTHLGISSLWVLLPAAMLLSAITAAFIGYMALRVKGMHFIFITIVFGQMLYAVAMKWTTITGGTDGLFDLTYPVIGISGFQWTAFSFHYFILLLLIICYYLMHRITNSSFGYALLGIRENEARMQVLGYNTWLYKYLVFIISGAFAGTAGALFAPFYGIVVPRHFGLMTSSMAVLMVVLCCPGTLYGPIIGSFLIILLEFFANVYCPERWPLILGAVFIVCVGVFTVKQTAVFGDKGRKEIKDDPEKEIIKKYEKSGLKKAEADNYFLSLEKFMREEKPYLDPDLTISDLSNKLGIQRHYLTQTINERLQKNFFMYVNEYRVREAKRMMDDENCKDYTLLRIAYESGFNSKSGFNTIFKRLTGYTPSEYKKKTGADA